MRELTAEKTRSYQIRCRKTFHRIFPKKVSYRHFLRYETYVLFTPYLFHEVILSNISRGNHDRILLLLYPTRRISFDTLLV